MAIKSDLHGMIPPLATPMHADGSLALEHVPALVEYVLAGGVHGIFVTGSQGESFALNGDEKAALWAAVLAAVNGRVPVIAGTGTITTRDTITLTRRAEALGVDAVAVVTPYFIAPTQDELYAHYVAVAAAVTVPILAYSNPGRTGGVKITPVTLARLAHEIPHFVGVKDSSGDLAECQATLRTCPEGFRVFVGRDTLMYSGLCSGAHGAVGLTINVAPALATAVYDAFQVGDHARARALQATISLLRDELPRYGSYPAPTKAALELLGVPVGPARLPILPLSAEQRVGLRTMLVRVGLLPPDSEEVLP